MILKKSNRTQKQRMKMRDQSEVVSERIRICFQKCVRVLMSKKKNKKFVAPSSGANQPFVCTRTQVIFTYIHSVPDVCIIVGMYIEHNRHVKLQPRVPEKRKEVRLPAQCHCIRLSLIFDVSKYWLFFFSSHQ